MQHMITGTGKAHIEDVVASSRNHVIAILVECLELKEGPADCERRQVDACASNRCEMQGIQRLVA